MRLRGGQRYLQTLLCGFEEKPVASSLGMSIRSWEGRCWGGGGGAVAEMLWKGGREGSGEPQMLGGKRSGGLVGVFAH